MPLFKFQNLNKYDNLRTRIVYSPTSAFSCKPKGLGSFINVQRFRYEYYHANLAPSMQIKNGEKFIIPGDIKVHPKTTFNDIVWIKPQPQKRQEPIVEINASSSSDVEYVTKYYPGSGKYHCTCPGVWRSKDRRCKHIKALEKKIQKQSHKYLDA